MPLRLGLLRTRVARRILRLFLTGALVPVVALAGISFVMVTRQLNGQSENLLEQLAENAGQSVLQQLQLMQGTLRRLSVIVAHGEASSTRFTDAVPPGVEALALADERGRFQELVGNVAAPPALDSVQRARLIRGMMVVEAGGGARHLLAAMALDSTDLRRGILWARMTGDSIWSAGDAFTSLSTRADFCLLGGNDATLFCHSGTDAVAAAFRAAAVDTTDNKGVIRHAAGGQSLISGYWRIPLKAAFGAPDWTVLVSEASSDVYAPLSGFRVYFTLAVALGLLAVLLLANVQIRHTMDPLDALEEGTKRVAGGDLAARVPVTSTDEFGVLANSFNRMAGRLGLQFRHLEARRAIDEAVLRAEAREDVLTAVLSHFGSVVPSRSVSVLLLDPADGKGHVLEWTELGEGERRGILLSRADLSWLRAEPHHRVLLDAGQSPDFIRRNGSNGPGSAPRTCIVLPLIVTDQVRGALWYEPQDGGVPDPDALTRAREITDQATVALDDLRVTEELKEMSWGTLRALARTIDVKSRWTAGHSERVTELALEIATEMGLEERELEWIHRGGLLHDIGKIGVPARILDWDGTLSAEDRALIELHPVIGGQILEPIRAFAPSLPIVTQHHEFWNGGGYPAGLRGEEIDPLARIVAVADVFDALASPRPYRSALDALAVSTQILRERGTHFEPAPVDAFLRVMARRGVVPTDEAGGADG